MGSIFVEYRGAEFKMTVMYSLCTLEFLLKVSLKPVPAAVFTVALLVPSLESEGERDTPRKCLQLLLTAVPAH